MSHEERRGKVDCNKAFNPKRRKFTIALEAINIFKVSFGLDDATIKDAQGNVSLIMERQLAYCLVWNATTEAEYPTSSYLADLNAIGVWFQHLMDALAVIAANTPKTDGKSGTGKSDSNTGDGKTADKSGTGKDATPDDKTKAKDPKTVAADLLKELSDLIAKPANAPKTKSSIDEAKKLLGTASAAIPSLDQSIAVDRPEDSQQGDPQQLMDELETVLASEAKEEAL